MFKWLGFNFRYIFFCNTCSEYLILVCFITAQLPQYYRWSEFEPRLDKTKKRVCAQRRLRSTWTSAKSDQSSLCVQWIAKDPRFHHADSEDADQTGRMPKLIWGFAERTLILLGLSCRGSFHFCIAGFQGPISIFIDFEELVCIFIVVVDIFQSVTQNINLYNFQTWNWAYISEH